MSSRSMDSQPIKVGTVVWLHSLSAAAHYNGQRALVIPGSSDGRLAVVVGKGEVSADKKIRVRVHNTRRATPSDDDHAATARIAWLVEHRGHVLPEGWPHDSIDCGHCGKQHDRSLCCGSPRKESHSGQLELITWGFDEKLAQQRTSEYYQGPMAPFNTLYEEKKYVCCRACACMCVCMPPPPSLSLALALSL